MRKMKRRKNGTGSAVYLGDGRYEPWCARLVIGKQINGNPVYFDLGTFNSELDALVCLENYHKNPYTLLVKEEKYNKIVTFPPNPYPLAPVQNIQKQIVEKMKKDNYTFKQVFEEFKKIKIPTAEEIKIEKDTHKKTSGKVSRNYASTLISGYNNSKGLYDLVYKDLRASDFQSFLDNSNRTYHSQRSMLVLYRKLDEYALQEDIIEKGYSQYVTISKEKGVKKEKQVYTYEQIEYLWNIKPDNYKEDFVRDLLLLSIYTGCRAEELLFINTNKIFLDKSYFVTGVKTSAGIDREIPIHPDVKSIFLKYYNKDNDFLFIMPNGNRTNYDYYMYHYKLNFIEKHPFLNHHTAHEGRHTLRTELERLNVKQVIINSIIGHSNENVGQDIYTHISIEEKLKAIKLITYSTKNNIYVLASNQ